MLYWRYRAPAKKEVTGSVKMDIVQAQTLSPQMIQSLEVLQMSAQELSDYLQKLSQENPVIELVHPQEPVPVMARSDRDRMEWLEANDRQNGWYHRQDTDEASPLHPFEPGEEASASLSEHILSQIGPCEAALETAVRFLAESLDANGWLEDELEVLARISGHPLPLLERALALIQQTDPAGVGARSISECLLLQLRRRPDASPLTLRIVRDHLSELAKNHFNSIARTLKVSQQEVRRSLEEIRTLDPRPGCAFAPVERTVYVIPDVIVVPGSGGLELISNDTTLPRLNISGYYTRMLGESDSEEVREYLTEKVRQAKWAVGAIQQRKETLLLCVQAIVRLQQDYFYRGGAIRPMRLADVAQVAQVHESTVSRAIRGKWLQSPAGIVPISKFFSRSLPVTQAAECSVEEAKRRLKKLIMEEDPAHPYTDQKLCDLMANTGCVLARRTVAKYRSEMGYPSATGRKR